MSLTSAAFARLVTALKHSNKTITGVESCCGGLIQSSILSQPGASAVFSGGTVSYNTKNALPVLLNDKPLHDKLTAISLAAAGQHANESEEEQKYVRSKVEHTKAAALAYCKQMGTDFAIAESGASGPTFKPKGLAKGFAAIAVAKRCGVSGEVSIAKQVLVRSSHNDRQGNMRMFADAAAKLALEAVQEGTPKELACAAAPTPSNDGVGYHFDRATKLRADANELLVLSKDAKYVVLRGGGSLFGDGWELRFLSLDEVRSIENASGAKAEKTFLGILDGKQAFFSADLVGGNDESIGDALAKDGDGGSHFQDTRTGAPLLSPLDNELALHATALSQWQRRSQFCALCGAPTALVHGGTCMKCSSCGAMSWPRQDPSMIAAITSRDGEHILLAHSQRHPPKLHTVLAGFIEAGETFEKGIAREVYEEAGIRIDKDSVDYIGSQPWPFPQSCMIGFTATADSSKPLNVDPEELEEARWFHKDEVRAAAAVEGATMRTEVAKAAIEANPGLTLLIPPKGVIARKLIDTWLDKLPL